MKTKIVSFGDSFVFGSELKDNPTGDQAWIGLAAKQLGVEYQTMSVPGCSNDNIFRQVLTYFSNNPADGVLAVINWTWITRWDFYVTAQECWTTIGPTCVPSILSRLVAPTEAERIIDFYQDHPGNSVLWQKYRNLQTIYATQQYLKSLGVVCIQTYMDPELWDQTWHAPDYIKTLQQQTASSMLDFEGTDFLTWSRNHGFEVTEPGWHPLEQAHQEACKLWVDKYAQAMGRLR